MSITVSDFVWKRLHEWGLKRVYGYPGDGVGGLDVALEEAKDFMEYVQVRHEEMAAFMASAHAKFTGGVGLCYATSGPGATHLITGLYDAKMDHVPVVAIVGQQARASIGASYQQEIDLQSAFKDVASEYVATGTIPAQVRTIVDRAVRIAQAKRTVTAIILPNDLQLMKFEEPPVKHGYTHTGVGFPTVSKVPELSGLQAAAEVLNAGKKVGMLVGAGALGATDEVIAVADRLGAGCAKALLGKAALPDDLPWVTGSLGLLGTKPSWDLLKGLRHLSDGRILLSLLGIPARAGQGARGADRHQRRQFVAALSDGGEPGRRRRRDPRGALAAAGARTPIRPGARRSPQTWPTGGRCWRRAPWTAPSRSIRSGCSGSCRRACRTTPSSPPTPARPPTGTPAT